MRKITVYRVINCNEIQSFKDERKRYRLNFKVIFKIDFVLTNGKILCHTGKYLKHSINQKLTNRYKKIFVESDFFTPMNDRRHCLFLLATPQTDITQNIPKQNSSAI